MLGRLRYVVLLGLAVATSAKWYDHMTGSKPGEKALGVKHYNGDPTSNPPKPKVRCLWTWDKNEKDARGFLVPVWECPHCDPATGVVYAVQNLRECATRSVYSPEELTALNAECDWISGRLEIDLDDDIVIPNILRITGDLYIGDSVKTFTAPKLVVASVIDIRGTSLTSCSMPALETICKGALRIASSSQLPSFSAPALSSQSSMSVVVEDQTVPLTIDLGSVGGGPSKIISRFSMTGLTASITITGLTNVQEVALDAASPSLLMHRLTGQKVCPLHGARVSVAGAPAAAVGAFSLQDTTFEDCSLRLSAHTKWSGVTIERNPSLRAANVPAVEMTGNLVIRDNTALRVAMPDIRRITGGIEYVTTAPTAPYNSFALAGLESVTGGILIDVTGTLTEVDLGSGPGGPTALHGTLHMTCSDQCGQLRGLRRVATVDNARPGDYVRIEGFRSIGRSPLAETMFKGAKAEVTMRRNNWQWIGANKAAVNDLWGPLTISDNPYLETLERPTFYDATKVGTVTISSNPLLPQACTATSIWGKPVVAMGNHPNTTLACV